MELININEAHKSTNVNIAQYLKSSTRNKIIAIKQLEEKKQPNSSITKLGENLIQKVGKEIIGQQKMKIIKQSKLQKNPAMHM